MSIAIVLFPNAARSTEPSFLQLRNGSSSFGHIESFAEGGYLIWQSEGFDRPFELPLDVVRSISLAAPKQRSTFGQRPHGWAATDEQTVWAIHISGQMQITGFPTHFGSQHLGWNSELLGQFTLDRSRALRIERLPAANSQPANDTLIRWRSRGQPSDWLFSDHTCSTIVRGAVCASALPDSPLGGYALKIRWRGTANFVVGLGPAQPPRANQGLRQIPIDEIPEIRPGLMQDNPLAIEAWAGKLFFVQNTGKQMQSATLGDFGDQSGVLHLILYPASESSPAALEILGGPRFELKRLEKSPMLKMEEIVVRNLGSFLSIDDFAVRPVNRQIPTDHRARKSDLTYTNGKVSSGGIVDWNTDSGTFRIQDGDSTSEIPEASLMSARFLPADNQNPETGSQPTAPWEAAVTETAFPKHIQAHLWDLTLRDGSRLRASMRDAREGRLLVGVQGISDALEIAADSIEELAAADDSARSAPLEPPIAANWVFVGSSQMNGSLVAAPKASRHTGLFWQPNSSRTPSELKLGVSAELHFARSPLLAGQDEVAEIPASGPRGGHDHAETEPMNRVAPDTSALVPSSASEELEKSKLAASRTYTIELTSGDKLQASVLGLDDQRVSISSPLLPAKELPHTWVQRVIFSEVPSKISMSEQQKNRLLTIPRNHVHDPPTHLLISRSGDVLRGNVLSLADGILQIEVRGRQVQLPQDGLSELIWLHHRSWETNQPESGLRIQVEGTDNSSTMVSSLRIRDGVLIGENQLLGQVEFLPSQISKIAVGTAARDRTYELRLAPSPQ